MDKSGENPKAITCYYDIDNNILLLIEKAIGKGVFTATEFSLTTKYDNHNNISGINADIKKFIELKTTTLGISSAALNEKLSKVKNTTDLKALIAEYSDDKYVTGLS